jgi:hypothetical protein
MWADAQHQAAWLAARLAAWLAVWHVHYFPKSPSQTAVEVPESE